MNFGMAAAIIGGGGWAPWKDADNVGHYEADRGVTVDGGNLVTSWDDSKSSRSQPLTIKAGFTGPLRVADDGDGKPAIRFNGPAVSNPANAGRDLLWRSSFSPLDLDSDFTFAGIARLDSTSGVAGAFMGFGDYPTPGRYVFYRSGAGVWFTQLANGTTVVTITGQAIADDAWHFVYGRRSAGTFAQSADGAAEGSASVGGGTFAADALTLGGTLQAPDHYLCRSRWRALSLYNTDIGAPRLTKLRAFWTSKWASP